MTFEILGLRFKLICNITPELDSNGNPKEYMPQAKYRNELGIPLHKYGKGPFCKFKIPSHYKETGVYVLFVNRQAKYVGECEDLSKRWNAGYGNISPRNCYIRGQPTNCRINNLMLDAFRLGHNIELLFCKTDNRFQVEMGLIVELQPEWNKTIGKKRASL